MNKMSDYSRLSKDDLLKVITKLESRKKYGLIWDEEKTKEQFEKESENALPVLKEVKGKEIKTDSAKPTNILIEGDNYHALSVLNYTHQGKIDVIYIDPPYNTGARDWKYNNDYVDSTDTYRHSKWLSFMSKRLELSKKLLKSTGILICTIDENEHTTLGMLLAGIFPDSEIVCITIIHNPGGIQGKNFSYCHEYAYFVYPKEGTYISNIKRDDIAPTPLRDWGKDSSKREAAKNCFYPILVKSNIIIGFGDVCENNYHPKKANLEDKNGIIEIYPIDKNGVERKWRFSRQSIEGIKNELICQEIKGELVILRDKRDYRWKTVWTDVKYNANVYGTQLVNKIIDEKFPFPKSLYAVRDCIKACVHPKDGIILDFFAGSGTTGHAVLELNKEDGGNRQFILCTNNELNGFEKELREQGLSEKEIQEHGICRRATYPRIAKVIKGYKTQKNEKVEGLGGNLKYYKTAFVKNSISQDDLKIRITRECTEMLCLREGIFDEVKAKPDYHIFEQNGKIMGVYYALERDSLAQLKKELDIMEGEKILYCFTLDPLGLNKKDFSDWQGVSLEAIPQPILDIYKDIYNL